MSSAFRKHGVDLVESWQSIIQEQVQVINADSNN